MIYRTPDPLPRAPERCKGDQMECPNCKDTELVKLEEGHKEYLEIKKEEEKIEAIGLRSEAFVCEKCGYINLVIKKEEG